MTKIFELGKLQPELPCFQWPVGGKIYQAAPEIYNLTTRDKYDAFVESKDIGGYCAFIASLFPGTTEDKIFTTDSILPAWALREAFSWVGSQIKGVPFKSSANKYSHEDAEALLDYVVREKAHKEHLSPEEMYEYVEGEVFRKKSETQPTGEPGETS